MILTFGAWQSDFVDAHPQDHHDVRTAYVEGFWLPMLGPSSLVMLRRLGRWLETEPCVEVEVEAFAECLGLGRGSSEYAPIRRTLRRLVQFNIATSPAVDCWLVRTQLPTLTPRQVKRLPVKLRVAHDQWQERYRPRTPQEGPCNPTK